MFLFTIACAFVCWSARSSTPPAPRQSLHLNGAWLFKADQSQEWKTVKVPSSFQSHEGTNFHGIGWYLKRVDLPPLLPGKRMLLHFQAVATEAEVWLDGERLGEHLGGWTPFRFDITPLLRKQPTHQNHEIRVRVDEKVGHNTQGFLPVIAPHFGGIWQDVVLLEVPEVYIDDLGLFVIGDVNGSQLRLEVPLAGGWSPANTNLALRGRLSGESFWTDLAPSIRISNGILHVSASVKQPRLWSPEAPSLYELEISLGADGDRVKTRAAFRSMETVGTQFRLNGRPLQIRGLLNWGFSPPLVEPNPGEAAWRSELELARSRGFNLMKFCLWVPPQRYLELADQMGLLTWMEYPTWHPDFSTKFLEPLQREFHEFFLYDRNHPSVVLRSLTCETGRSADLNVIKSLYDSAHQLIPGALVEDDSSWISWNRVNDFYDDHPYGNNHTWVKTLNGFKQYIQEHRVKPLVLGEAMAADTWLDEHALLEHFANERPWYAPAVLDEDGAWVRKMRRLAGDGGLDSLRADSLRYGLLMRKYQAETFRREIPDGGYVISVIRDIPKASMGLIDYLGRPKWAVADWAWQRDTICLLKTPEDQRGFGSDGSIKGQIRVNHFGAHAIRGGQLRVTLESPKNPGEVLQREEKKDFDQACGILTNVLSFEWPAPAVSNAAQLVIRAELKSTAGEFRNEWPIWVVPKASAPVASELYVHRSISSELRQQLFRDYSDFGPGIMGKPVLVAASRFDDELVQFLDQGGRVLLLPDGQRDSFALNAHWFLRGAPYVPDQALRLAIPREFLVELQHFDLAADIVPNLPCLEMFDPILMLWDTHDQSTVSTHGVIFETRAGQGRLLVSAARHGGSHNPAGRWLLGVLMDHLRSSQGSRHALSPGVWSYLKSKVHADQAGLISPPPSDPGLNLLK